MELLLRFCEEFGLSSIFAIVLESRDEIGHGSVREVLQDLERFLRTDGGLLCLNIRRMVVSEVELRKRLTIKKKIIKLRKRTMS